MTQDEQVPHVSSSCSNLPNSSRRSDCSRIGECSKRSEEQQQLMQEYNSPHLVVTQTQPMNSCAGAKDVLISLASPNQTLAPP